MADHRLGMVHAVLDGTEGRSVVRLTLDEHERDLGAVMHAVICAAPGDRPGRTVDRHVRWPAPPVEPE